MNILPLILALVLMLSVLTVEKMEKFKNQTIVQKQYQRFLKENERQVFNQRQKRLFRSGQKNVRQLTFRYLVDKTAREANLNTAKQYRLLVIELMKIVYGEAAFFKKMEKSRPNFLEELMVAIEATAETSPDECIKRVEDIARLPIEDKELQEVFYHMLKGTISRQEVKDLKLKEDESKDARMISPKMKEKMYISLLAFINYEGKHEPKNSSVPRISIQHCPREILKAIFIKDEIVEAILKRRNELAASKDAGAKKSFENEFKDKRRSEIDDQLLDFSISETDKSDYD